MKKVKRQAANLRLAALMSQPLGVTTAPDRVVGKPANRLFVMAVSTVD
jgi:hypothetical protein